MRLRFVPAVLCMLAAGGAAAAAANDLSDKEVQGRQLVGQILQQWPATNVTQTGVLKIRDAQKRRFEIPIKCKVNVAGSNWSSLYEATFSNRVEVLLIVHAPGRANEYFYDPQFTGQLPSPEDGPGWEGRLPMLPAGKETMVPYAGSDFWIGDLGMEFLHWPEQKLVKRVVRSSRGCSVLESTNPDPATNGYSRVISWIDSESLGPLHAEAYDSKGKLLKEYDTKKLRKIKGQWQVEEMEIDNDQTGSRTWLVFDLKKE